MKLGVDYDIYMAWPAERQADFMAWFNRNLKPDGALHDHCVEIVVLDESGTLLCCEIEGCVGQPLGSRTVTVAERLPPEWLGVIA